jgi:hypothetical protein
VLTGLSSVGGVVYCSEVTEDFVITLARLDEKFLFFLFFAYFVGGFFGLSCLFGFAI